MPCGRNPEEKRIIEMAVENGQGHLFRFWDELSDSQKDQLVDDVRSIDFRRLEEAVGLLNSERKLDGHFRRRILRYTEGRRRLVKTSSQRGK